ncbi:MAG TPA: hypothetical protein VLJ21_02255 [Candidatus Binatia bacterium]|nr:hypothetical protein [Candidatus Binatia bacterium]
MKRVLALLTIFLFSIPTVFAQTCATEEQLNAHIADCTSAGKGYAYAYDYYNCKYVTCTDQTYTCPTQSELDSAASNCKAAGLSYTTYKDEHDCTQVRCLEHEATCPTREQLDSDRATCRTKGMFAYEKTDTNDCAYIVCGSAACQSESEYQSQILKCQEYGKTYETVTDSQGCKFVKCIDKCAAMTQVSCASGTVAVTLKDEHGCSYQKCVTKGDTTNTCTKMTDVDNCIIFTCKDGSSYNSCKQDCSQSTETKPEAGEAPTPPPSTEGFWARFFSIFRSK